MTRRQTIRHGVRAAIFAALAFAGAAAAIAGSSHQQIAIQARISGYMRNTETVAWASAANATGYDLYRDGAKVATAGPSATSTRFSVSAGTHTLAIVPIFATTTTTSTTTTVTTTAASNVCSRTTLAACPPSYFTGPLSVNNLLPSRPGAFLADVYGGIGTSYDQFKTGVLQREADIGRPFDGLGFHYDGSLTATWGGVAGMNDPTAYSSLPEQWIHDHGSTPLIVWTPNYTLAQMNAGAADAVWGKAARYWAQFPFTIMLRAFNEFDGLGLPYQGCGSSFIGAWQRMVGVFKQNGATNVGFWWNPTEGQNRVCVASSYPGDGYVDWVGSDWYNVCLVGNTSQFCTPLHSGWASFAEIFNYTALGSTAISQHDAWGPHKPFIIGETGSWYDSNYPSFKGAWQAAIPAAAQQMRYLRGVELYDSDVSAAEGPLNNFRVDYPTSDPSVYDGFKQLAADPWFHTG